MFEIDTIPTSLSWHNEPVSFESESAGHLSMNAAARTDFFIDPSSGVSTGNAPLALFDPGEGDFMLSARVRVGFAGTFDAGSLHVRSADDVWGKLCFEYSPQKEPMVVSVVTRGLSDDCNSAVIRDNSVYLRIGRLGDSYVFHYSTNGEYWHLVRHFALDRDRRVMAGFSAQSPLGSGCAATFSDIRFSHSVPSDIRSGK